MDDGHSTTPQNAFAAHIERLIDLLRVHDVDSEVITMFIKEHPNCGEIQCILDIKEMLDQGLIT